MIFADKLIDLRKKNGWTQEELAEKMNVSRQSVSKWEGAQSIPDLEKLLRLSQLFGVSTDYLLKDELDTPEFTESAEEAPTLRQVTMEEANEFLALTEQTARPIALGVALCILSPVALLMLGAWSESGMLRENLAGGIGTIVLLAMISAAVAVFISVGSKTDPFDYLKSEVFETAYGVEGMVRERQKRLRSTYHRCIAMGVALCILSPVPLMTAAAITEDEIPIVGSICVLLGMVALGVAAIITVGSPWEAMSILLQEGEFSPANKRRSRITGVISTVYWLIVVAAFLGYSFVTNDWSRSWIIWPVAGVLFAAVKAVCDLVIKA